MKYYNYELDEYEKEILKDYEAGKFKPVSKRKLEQEKIRLKTIAKTTLDKTKNVNLRISYGDLHKIKVKAMEKGIPYQTLMASLIHQYSNNRLKEQ